MKAERDTKIRELWEQGLSVRKIAESLGVGKTVVHAVVVALKEEVSGKDQMANSGHPPRNLPDQ